MNQAHETRNQLQKHAPNNVLDPTLPGINSFEEGGHELTQAQSVVLQCGKPDSYYQPMDVLSANPHGNGIRTLEFGSFDTLPQGSSQLALGNSNARGSTSSFAELEVQNSEQLKGEKQGRYEILLSSNIMRI